MATPGKDADEENARHSDEALAQVLEGRAFLTEVQMGTTDRSDSHRLYEHDPEKGFTLDIMMMMDMAKVSSLRQEFQQKDRGLSIAEFVLVMMRFVQNSEDTNENSRLRNLSERQLVANLCELFAQIDINGDGSMEWEEFTSFIVETGLTVKSHQPNSIQQYYHVPWEDASKHSTFIDHLYYFPVVDTVAVIENCSSYFKLYNPHCELLRTVRSPEGFVQCAEHLPKHSQYVLASSDLQFRFYDDSTLRLMKSCHTPTSQNCLKWYPETNALFSAGVSGIVYAWDAERMEEKHHMGGEVKGKVLVRSHDDIVLDLLNLPTLESLASASMDRTIRLWDVHVGKLKQQLDGHTKGVRSLAYSPEYRFLVSAGFDFDAMVWNPYVDQLILRLHGHNNSLCGVEIIPDSPQIITADIDGIFKVWDIRNFACLQTFSAESLGDVKNVVAVNSQKRIVVAGKKLAKFDYEKLENPDLTDDHPTFAALYNPTSLSFITAAGRDIKIWDARLGKLLRVYRGLSQLDLTSLILDCRERKIIVGDHGGDIQVFDYLNGSQMKSFAYSEVENRAHTSEVTRLCYCAEHMAVISASWDCAINIHDESESERGILLRRLTGGHTTDISSLSFSPTLSLIASGSSDSSLYLWDFEFGRFDSACIGHVSSILALQFLDPFPLLLATDNTGNICFWGTRSSRFKAKCVYRFRNQRGAAVGGGIASVNCVATHTTATSASISSSVLPSTSSALTSYLVLTGDDKGAISVWNMLPTLNKLEEDFGLRRLETPKECANPRRNLRVNAAGMVRKIRNGPEWAAFQQRDRSVSFFFTAGMPLLPDAQPVCMTQWRAHSDVVYSIQMIPEPESLVTASFDRRVKIWSLHGECLGILMQGEKAPSKRPWRFAVNYDARESKKELEAAPVIEDVHELLHAEEQERQQRRHAQASARWRRRSQQSPDILAPASDNHEKNTTDEEEARLIDAGGGAGPNGVSPPASMAVLPPLYSQRQPPPPSSTRRNSFLDRDPDTEMASMSSALEWAVIPVGAPTSGMRKTPRLKPVSAAHAGRTQIMSPRQLRVLNSARTHSPR